MKLYTEEQVRGLVMALCDYNILKEEVAMRELTPIELPSDDDMANASNHCKDGQVKVGFLRGVLWYQEQILNQNNLNNGTTTNI